MSKIFYYSAILLVSLFPASAYSQSVSPQVIVSSGDISTSAAGSLEWSLGEISTETFVSTGNILTQGFHQDYYDLTSIGTIEPVELAEILIYPNPVSQYVYLDFKNRKGKFNIELYNMQGKLMKSFPADLFSGSLIHFALPGESGLYFIRVSNHQDFHKSYPIHKL